MAWTILSALTGQWLGTWALLSTTEKILPTIWQLVELCIPHLSATTLCLVLTVSPLSRVLLVKLCTTAKVRLMADLPTSGMLTTHMALLKVAHVPVLFFRFRFLPRTVGTTLLCPKRASLPKITRLRKREMFRTLLALPREFAPMCRWTSNWFPGLVPGWTKQARLPVSPFPTSRGLRPGTFVVARTEVVRTPPLVVVLVGEQDGNRYVVVRTEATANVPTGKHRSPALYDPLGKLSGSSRTKVVDPCRSLGNATSLVRRWLR